MWYDHPNWWQWLVLIGIVLLALSPFVADAVIKHLEAAGRKKRGGTADPRDWKP